MRYGRHPARRFPVMDTEHTGVENEALDAYSRVVTGVATSLLPSVAALSVRTPRGAGAGSAVTFTDDGFLLTNAHVVAGATGGTAAFADGTETKFDVTGADALSDLAVVRVHHPGAPAAPLGDADALRIGQLVVAVLGRINAADATALLRLQRNRAQALALVMDIDTWSDQPPTPRHRSGA